jgi:hypothetical protein
MTFVEFRRIQGRLWAALLCVLIVSASLDQIPDPPAIKQSAIQSPGFSVHPYKSVQADQAQVQQALEIPVFSPVSIHQVLPALSVALESPLLRLAADSSPPNR